MKTKVRHIGWLIIPVFLCFGLGLDAHAAVVFDDAFDAESADSGDPDNYLTFGTQRTDRGVETSPNLSAPNAAFITLDYSLSGFGAGFVRTLSGPTLLDVALSVYLRSDTDESGNLGTVGFRLEDSDGSVYRTADVDLFVPSTSFGLFSQSVGDLITVDAAGSTPGLDVSNIVSYGLLFLDRGDVNDVVIYNIDNFSGTNSVPEPGTAGLVVLGLLSALRYRMKR